MSLAGGGTALVKVGGKLSKRVAAGGDSEFSIGYNALVGALYTPLRQIAVNAGRDDGAVIVQKVKKSTSDAYGYDASGDPDAEPEMTDLIKRGIVDPVKVTRTALENAASAAAMLITTEVAIADEPERKTASEPHGSHEF